MSRRGSLFGFSLLWFFAGAAFLIAVLLFYRPVVSNDYAYALSLYKNNKQSEFVKAVEAYLAKATLDETKKLLRLSLELETPFLEAGGSVAMLRQVPDSYLKDEIVFNLLKVMQRRVKSGDGMASLFGRAARSFDTWPAEFDDEQNPNKVKRLSRIISLLTNGEATSFSNLFQIASERTKSPEIMYGAALLNALRGDMSRALEYYPVSINKEHLEGRIDLLVSAGKQIETELLAHIDTEKDKPKLVAMKAQEQLKAGFETDAFRTYFLLLSRLPVNSENIEIADALLYFSKHRQYTEEVRTLTRQSHELLKSWQKILTIPVPLDSFGYEDEPEDGHSEKSALGHDEAISALWFEFGREPSDARIWKTLAWFLVHDRDDRGLEKLLARVKAPLHPYFLLYSGCLHVLREQYDSALSFFDQAGKAGLPYGYLCKASILEWQGRAADASEARAQAQRFILTKGDVSHDKTQDSSGH